MQFLLRTARVATLIAIATFALHARPTGPTTPTGPAAAPKAAPDSSAQEEPKASFKDTISHLTDSLALAHLRDSLSRIVRNRHNESDDLRPGRKLLRSADPTLFASHTGSVGPDYPLGPGDALTLTLWGQKQARYDLEIDRDGQVQIPSVGSVSLNGTTFGEAQKTIGRRLATVYSGIGSGNSQFDLTMQKLKQIRVFVVGEVEKPGGYILSGNTSALQALTLAGGPTQKGSERFVQVTRGDQTFDIDLYTYLFLARRPKRDVLLDGDIVRIPAAKGMVQITGAIARPALFEISDKETLSDVIAFSGGFTVDLDADAPLTLVRTQGNQNLATLLGNSKEVASTGKSTSILAGDRIQVPSKSSPRRASPIVVGAVLNPGIFPYSQGLTVRGLVSLAGGPKTSALKTRVVVFRMDSTGASTVLRTDLTTRPDLPVFPFDSVVVSDRERLDSDTAHRVEIVGAVRHPGRYPWTPGLFAKDLVVLAGGFLPSADTRSIRIEQREADASTSKTTVIAVDSTLGMEPDEQPIGPHAIVSVDHLAQFSPQGRCVVTGLVKTPGTYAVLSPNERVASLVRRAGGLSSNAFGKGAQLWRPSEGRIPLDLPRALKKQNSDDNVLLQDGDSLHIPATPATVRVTGRVHQPTQVLWRDGEGWEWYVKAAGGFADSANRKGVYVEYADGSIQSFDQGPDDPTPGSTVVVPRTDPPRTSTAIEKISAFGTIASATATLLTVYVLYLTTNSK